MSDEERAREMFEHLGGPAIAWTDNGEREVILYITAQFAAVRAEAELAKDAEIARLQCDLRLAISARDYANDMLEKERGSPAPDPTDATDFEMEISSVENEDGSVNGDDLRRLLSHAYACGALAALKGQGDPAEAMRAKCGQRVRHKKRGSTYRVVGQATIQTERPISDNEPVVTYQCEADGRLWARPPMEFYDGRFEDAALNGNGDGK